MCSLGLLWRAWAERDDGHAPLKRLTATILGFLAAPVVPAFVFTVEFIITDIAAYGNIYSLGMMAVFYYFSLIFTVLFAVPLALIANYFGITQWWVAVSGGLIIGILTDLIVELPRIYFLISDYLLNSIEGLLTYGATGALSGFVFWLIWQRGNRGTPQPSNSTGMPPDVVA